MTMPRAHLVDPAVTRWYHCVTRCVRRAFLLSEGPLDRKQWIDQRLEELAGIFAVSVGGFSIMDNHLHVLVRLDPDLAKDWSDEDVVRRWGRLPLFAIKMPPASFALCATVDIICALRRPPADSMPGRFSLNRSSQPPGFPPPTWELVGVSNSSLEQQSNCSE
jgi:hypothetical protein